MSGVACYFMLYGFNCKQYIKYLQSINPSQGWHELLINCIHSMHKLNEGLTWRHESFMFSITKHECMLCQEINSFHTGGLKIFFLKDGVQSSSFRIIIYLNWWKCIMDWTQWKNLEKKIEWKIFHFLLKIQLCLLLCVWVDNHFGCCKFTLSILKLIKKNLVIFFHISPTGAWENNRYYKNDLYVHHYD